MAVNFPVEPLVKAQSATHSTAGMIIPVYTDGQKLEYFTIELQGQLEPTHGEILDGLRIGALRVEQVRCTLSTSEVSNVAAPTAGDLLSGCRASRT